MPCCGAATRRRASVTSWAGTCCGCSGRSRKNAERATGQDCSEGSHDRHETPAQVDVRLPAAFTPSTAQTIKVTIREGSLLVGPLAVVLPGIASRADAAARRSFADQGLPAAFIVGRTPWSTRVPPDPLSAIE